MYAIFESGGKQYRVEKGDVVEVELLNEKTGPVEFKQILFFNDGTKLFVGSPHVTNCLVQGEILKEVKGPKVIAYKYKRRKNYRKKIGHRQKYAKIKITEIKGI